MRKSCVKTKDMRGYNYVAKINDIYSVCKTSAFYAVFASLFNTQIHTQISDTTPVISTLLHSIHTAYNKVNQVNKLFINIMQSGELV